MSTKNGFEKIMQQRTDVELLEIVTTLRSDYQPDAVLAAEIELKSRNLSPDQREYVQQKLEQTQKIKEQKANEPLEVHWKVLCMIFPGIINFFIAFYFKGTGNDKKFRETWRWTLYGFGIVVGFGLTLVLINWLLKF
jgi:hypothetical protein